MEIPPIEQIIEISDQEKVVAAMIAVATVAADESTAEGPEAERARKGLIKAAATVGGKPVEVDQYWESLTETRPSNTWRSYLMHQAERVAPHRLATICARSCLINDYIEGSAMASGPTMRRMDGVLDVLVQDFCASDVQDLFVTMAGDLAASKLTWAHTVGAGSAGFAGGVVEGMFGIPGISHMAGKGTEYFLNESSKIDEASEACALLLVQGISLATSPEGRPEILLIRDTLAELAETNGQRLARHRSRSANVYTGEAAQIDKQGKVLRSAVSALNEMLSDDEASDDTPPRRPMPDVVGQPLSVAKDLLEVFGTNVVCTDPQGRNHWNDANWVVRAQEPQAGEDLPEEVTLTIAKFSD